MPISTGLTGKLLLEQAHPLTMQRELGVNFIYALGQTIGYAFPSRAFWERLAQYAAALTQVPYSQIIISDGSTSFACKAIYGSDRAAADQAPDLSPVAPFFAEVQRRGSALSLTHEDAGVERMPVYLLGLDLVKRVWLVPMKVGQDFVGILVLGDNGQCRACGLEDGEARQLDLMTAIADLIASTIFRIRYHHTIEDVYLDVLIGLAKTLDGNNPFMEHHADRTATLVKELAGQLGYSDAELAALRWAGLLHDVGKIGIPGDILFKPGPLTPHEWFIIKKHPVIGAEFLAPVASMASVVPIVRGHHEHFDGTGYPDGLKGKAIPGGARVLAVADAYTCLTDGRPYRRPYSREEAAAELVRSASSQFDPNVIQAFMVAYHQGRV